MAEKNYTVDPVNGNVNYTGPSETTKGNHKGMPSRTEAYLPTDERGHVQASSEGGSNKRDNIVPMAHDLNHGSYLHMENAEKVAHNDGVKVTSDKTAFVDSRPGDRPTAFIVNDTLEFQDGTTQHVHLSFANMENDQQTAINNESIAVASEMMDEFDNPGDALRESMTSEEYAALMEETDAALPNIADNFSQWDYEGPGNETGQGMESAANPDGADVPDADANGPADADAESDSDSAGADGAGADYGDDGGAGPGGSDDD